MVWADQSWSFPRLQMEEGQSEEKEEMPRLSARTGKARSEKSRIRDFIEKDLVWSG